MSMRWWATRKRREQDASEELQSHFAMALHDRLDRGEPPESAERAVQREFGSRTLVKEEIAEVWGWSGLDVLRQDLRDALRTVRRSPGFTAVAVLSLALGIGANTAIFSIINTVMLRSLPVKEPHRLVQLMSNYPGEPRVLGFGWRYYEHYRDLNHVFSDLIGLSAARFQASGQGLDLEPIDGGYVTGNFFPALGIQAAIGRLIDVQDDRVGDARAAVAVVSWPYWKSRWNLDRSIIGTKIALDGVPATVIGVTPREFFGLQVGLRSDIWVPAALEPMIRRPSQLTAGSLGLAVMGRLQPGTSIEQARAELRVLDKWRIDEVTARSNDPLWRQVTIDVESAATGFSALRDRFGQPLLVLMAIVGVLLLLACTNIASMMLARGAARQREMAVRVALGAGRGRLVRQVLTESLVLSTAGGLLGVFLAYAGADMLLRIIASGRPLVGWPGSIDIQIQPDLQVLSFTAGVALLAGVLFGLAPASAAFASAPASSLREIGGAAETRSRRLFGKGLVVAQVALSVVLLSTAALFVRHLSALRSRDLGFVSDSVLLVTLNAQGSGYNRYQLTALYRDVLDRLQGIPGVRSASLSGVTPIEGGAAARFARVEGFDERAEDRRYLMLNWIGPKYFETLRTPLVAGRDFEFADETRPRVAIVNQAVARHYFRDRNPIGMHLTLDGDSMPYEIVGVAGDAKYRELHQAAPPTVYLNTFQEGRISSEVSIRTSARPTAIATDVRRVIEDVVKPVKIAKVTTLTDQLDASIVPERLIASLSGSFATLGAFLAAIGLYGLLAYSVARRTSEIGIRMALGATRRDVTSMVLKSALGLTGAGLVIGVPAALWTRHVAASLIADLSASAAMPIAAAAAGMVLIALIAAYVPSRRAAGVQPMEALRH